MREDDFIAPDLPDDIQAEDLDIGARAQLKTLSKDNADYVAKHMARASQLIDENPELAHQHALSAARRAGRIGVVRETLAITAYQLGDFSLALRELRTYRRITGRDDQLPLMADCERGLGRPEKALELARSVDASTLDTDVRVELAIVKSGARLDLGQKEAALEELRIPELREDKAFDYSPALFASFAGVLEELGRDEEAAKWFALADRAIDALEAALAPGELESVGIVTERIESDDDADALEADDEAGAEDSAETGEAAGEPVVEAADVPAVETVDAAPEAVALVGTEDVPDPEAVAEAPVTIDVVDAADVPEHDGDAETAADAAPVVEAADVPERIDVPADDVVDAPVVESADVPADEAVAVEADAAAADAAAADDADAVVAEADDAVADADTAVVADAPVADAGDALFGDALFGDELISEPTDVQPGEAGPSAARSEDDAR